MTVTLYEELEQRSPEWYAARCGIVTASAISALVTVASPAATTVPCETCSAPADSPCISLGRKSATAIKTFHDERIKAASNLPPTYVPADNDTSRSLTLALAAERITAYSEETFTTRDMERGIFAEPFARDLYAEHCTTERVTEIGFAVRDFGDFKIGYSPDGLVGSNGLIEIKAPRQKGHLSTVVTDEIPAHYMAQLQTGLLVLERDWIDFVSYAGGMHLWPKRVTPDPAWRAAIIAAAEKAEREIREHMNTYQSATKGLPLAPRIDLSTEIF